MVRVMALPIGFSADSQQSQPFPDEVLPQLFPTRFKEMPLEFLTILDKTMRCGKRLHNSGKAPWFSWENYENSLFLAIFNSYVTSYPRAILQYAGNIMEYNCGIPSFLYVYQRVTQMFQSTKQTLVYIATNNM